MRQNETDANNRTVIVTVFDLSGQPKGGLTGLTVKLCLPGTTTFVNAFNAAVALTGGSQSIGGDGLGGDYAFTLGGPSDLTNETATAGDIAYQVFKSDGTTLVTRGQIQIEPALRTIDVVDGALTNAKIADGFLTAAKVANNTITASTVAANTIGNTQIADNAIGASKIASNAITSAKVAADTIGASQIAAGAITNAKLANGAIDAPNLVDGLITSTKLANGAITAASIAANAIGASQIAANAITAAKIAGDALSAIATAILTATVYTAGVARTIRGILFRQDRNLIGKAINLNAGSPTVYAHDEVTAAFATSQDTGAGTRTTAAQATGD